MTIGFIIQRTWYSTNANVIILVYFHCFRLLFCANSSDFILILYFYRYHRCHSIVIFCSFFYALRFIYVYRVYIHKCSSSNGSTNIVAFICHVDDTISSHILIFILFSIFFSHTHFVSAWQMPENDSRHYLYANQNKTTTKTPLKIMHSLDSYSSVSNFMFFVEVSSF